MIPRKLLYRQHFSADAADSKALDALMQQVFDFAPLRTVPGRPTWVPFSYFDDDDRCVAGIEAARLTLVLDGRSTCATAIRLAAVAERHRGQGLFKALVARALAWCEAACAGPTLLYAEDDALYAPFGFAPLPQHAFIGAAPAAAAVAPAALLDRAEAARMLDLLGPRRTPVSNMCALVDADDLLREVLRGDEPFAFAYAAELNALLVYAEQAGDTLVLVDVVAAALPTMAQIIGTLGARWPKVRTSFPPDRLDWDAKPEPEETGLIVRGAVPAAMRRPFMLPPTTAF